MNKIFLLGDSTCADYPADKDPQRGWGQLLPEYIAPGYEVINLAYPGRSTKSFLDLGHFKPCQEKAEKGDYVFIQFGHNDEKKEDPTRYTEPFGRYQKNLRYYISEVRSKGATPVLLSSIYRRYFLANGKMQDNVHMDYPKAMEEVAKQEGVLYIDMCAVTKEALQKIGDEPSKVLFMYFPAGMYPNFPEGQQDNTHLREKGARFICELLIKEMKKTPLKDLFH